MSPISLQHRISNLKEIVSSIFTKQTFINSYKIDDQTMINAKIKQLLVGILLGMFAGKKWDGTLQSNGTIVIKKDGEIVGFHIIKLDILKDFLLDHIKLDTPSSTRHLFGKIIDINGKLFFKLNLQLRFI